MCGNRFVLVAANDGVRDSTRYAAPHRCAASPPGRDNQRPCRVDSGRRPQSARRAHASGGHRSRPRAESLPPVRMWTSVLPTMWIAVADRIGQRRRIWTRIVRGHGSPAEGLVERPHHARSVSMSRSTCMASARSASSAASFSASARIAAAALLRAASMRAVRTAFDTGVPSCVNTASARDASSSGRNVIVSAIRQLYYRL